MPEEPPPSPDARGPQPDASGTPPEACSLKPVACSPQPTAYRLPASVFLIALAVYAVTLGRPQGWLYCDGADRFATTYGIVERGSLRLGVKADGSPRYSKYGIVQPALGVPLYLVGKAVAGAGAEGVSANPAFYCHLLNSFVTAATCAALVWILRRQGFTASTTLLVAAAYGLATVAWPNARWYGSEPLSALLLLIFIHCLSRIAEQGTRTREAVAAAVAGGALVLHTTMAGPLVAGLVVWTAAGRLWRGGSRRERNAWVLAGMILALALVALLAYNRARGGSVLRTGYEGDHGFATFPYSGKPGFSANLLVGLYGNLFSVGRSVFLYSPPALLGVVFFGVLWRVRPRFARLALVAALYYLLVWSKWWAWYGGACWGNRTLLPVLPLLMPAVAAGWERVRGKGLARPALFAAVLVLGVLVQVPALLVFPGDHYLRVIGPRYENEYRIHFVPHASPLAGHTGILLNRPFADSDLLWLAGRQPTPPQVAVPPAGRAIWLILSGLTLAAGILLAVGGVRAAARQPNAKRNRAAAGD